MARRTFVSHKVCRQCLRNLRTASSGETYASQHDASPGELTESGRSTLGEAADAVNAVEERMLGKRPILRGRDSLERSGLCRRSNLARQPSQRLRITCSRRGAVVPCFLPVHLK